MTSASYRYVWQILSILAIIVVVTWHTSQALAATYYVDPVTGNDTNAGTSQATPWKTIPGTRTQNNRAWLQTAWGNINTSNKLKPGDTIELKAGSVMNAFLGGRLVVDATFYNDGTATSPIVIRVSSTWGSGHFTYDCTNMTPTAYDGMISVASRNHIYLKGADNSRRFVVTHAPGDWAISLWGEKAQHQAGILLSYVEINQSLKGGLNISYSDHWTVSHTTSHDNGTIGFAVGGLNDEHAANGTFQDAEAYHNGFGDTSSSIRHGFGLYGATNITYQRCKSHHNQRDGYDFGTVLNTNDSSAVVVDSVSYDNGEDGFGTNGGSGTNASTYINTIAFNNGQAGWNIYGGATAYLYHTIAHHNGNQNSYGGNYMIYSESWATTAVIRNSVAYKPKSYANVYSYDSGGLKTNIDSDYNIFVPRADNKEVMSETPFGTVQSYNNPPTWSGPHDKRGLQYDPNFVRISTADFSQNDYHLTAGSSAAVASGVWLKGSIDVQKDRDGHSRIGTVNIGLYQSPVADSKFYPPVNLRRVDK